MQSRKRITFLLIAAIIIYSAAFILFNANIAASVDPALGLTVSAADLAAAGFTSPVTEEPTENAYLPPVRYFRVAENVTLTNPEWGTAADLVAVLIRPMSDPDWRYNNGETEFHEYSGRFQARASRSGYYIAVTGPDREKVGRLATLLLNK